jgi:hypothetical protein
VVFDGAEAVAADLEGPNGRRFEGGVAQGGENPSLHRAHSPFVNSTPLLHPPSRVRSHTPFQNLRGWETPCQTPGEPDKASGDWRVRMERSLVFGYSCGHGKRNRHNMTSDPNWGRGVRDPARC